MGLQGRDLERGTADQRGPQNRVSRIQYVTASAPAATTIETPAPDDVLEDPAAARKRARDAACRQHNR